MPLYEYECKRGHKHELIRPMRESAADSICPGCGEYASRIISRMSWHMGWKFLKGKSEKSPPAPIDSGYYPEWDQAYSR